ncbi:DNA phosphorothioation-associated protein 4 [Shewanella colwelliana]|uniref:DNA phosphorothioation-associated protein 4 n=1 Tax=Shewanella colwelliana TaxID=23 RepID=UPI00299E124F|nr:DNA phosphorothioation-associated protein 4 [Shewanella colwelliana]MDX1282976.1 DNA phosphorothioation-associated protein 4 [Shewanella colwelliana]
MINKDYRVRRPQQYDSLISVLKSEGVFSSFKSVLVFAAVIGFKQSKRIEFSDSSEKIPLHIFSDDVDIPLINCIALAETEDVNILRRESFEKALIIFEEYACGGLAYLEGVIDLAHCKESIQRQIQDLGDNNLTIDITDLNL